MSKSAIYVVNTNEGTNIATGNVYPVNQVIRRFGCDISSNGVGITCKNTGYYKVSGTISAIAVAAGTLQASLYNNGAPVPGATSTITATEGGNITFPLDAIVRVNCCGNPADITVVISGGTATMVNAELSAFKL